MFKLHKHFVICQRYKLRCLKRTYVGPLRALIKSVLNNGIEAYFIPKMTQEIQKIANETRLCTSALPQYVLFTICSEMLSVTRHNRLSLNYRAHLTFKHHPTHAAIQE